VDEGAKLGEQLLAYGLKFGTLACDFAIKRILGQTEPDAPEHKILQRNLLRRVNHFRNCVLGLSRVHAVQINAHVILRVQL
jgi:hypothetical protein